MRTFYDGKRRNLSQLAGHHILNGASRSRRVGIVAKIHNRDADTLTLSRFKNRRTNSQKRRKYQKKNKLTQKRHEKHSLSKIIRNSYNNKKLQSAPPQTESNAARIR